ncbi:hypothetical protein LCGC14_2968430, partial [marine sediment metagenome]
MTCLLMLRLLLLFFLCYLLLVLVILLGGIETNGDMLSINSIFFNLFNYLYKI